MKLSSYILLLFFVELILETGFDVNTKIVEGFSLKNLFLYGLFSSIFIAYVSSGYGKLVLRPARQFNKWYVILAAWAGFSILVGTIISIPGYEAFPSAMLYKTLMVDTMLCYFVFFLFLTKNGNAEIVLKLLVFTLSVFSSLTLVELITGINFYGLDDSSARPNGPLGEPNQTAALLACLVPISLSFVMQKDKYFIFYVGCVLVLLGSLIVSGSRGGWVACVMGLSAWMFFSRNLINLQTKTLILVSLPVVAMAAYFVVPEYYQQLMFERLGLMPNDKVDIDQASAGRTVLWRIAIELWGESPFVGVGWAGYKLIVNGATHNNYLDYMVNTGLVGLGIYLVSLYKYFVIYRDKTPSKNKSDEVILVGVKSGFISLLVAVFFVNLYMPFMIAWCILGAAAAYANQHQLKKLQW